MALTFPDGFPFTKRTPKAAKAAALAESPAAAAATPADPAGAAPAHRPERRRSPRQTLVAKATVRPDTGVVAPESVAAGFVSNISMNGIGFHTRRPLAVGEKYRISIELGPMKWSSRLRVVTCAPHDTGTFDVGAEFVGNELMARGVAA